MLQDGIEIGGIYTYSLFYIIFHISFLNTNTYRLEVDCI